MTANSSLVTFLDDLASERPTPGGGGAAAVSGAIGAALVSMVANLTIGKKNYEAVREDLEAVNAKAEVLRAELIRAIDEDVVAFNSVMGAYGLPRATDEEKAKRAASIQAALRTRRSRPCAPSKPVSMSSACPPPWRKKAISMSSATLGSPCFRLTPDYAARR